MEEQTTELQTTGSEVPATIEDVANAVIAADKVTPVSIMENQLSAFMTDSFNIVRNEDDYYNAVHNQIKQNLPTMKNDELIALSTSMEVNRNDLISKMVAPTMQLLTARQQNELAERKEAIKEKEQMVASNSAVNKVSSMAPSEVLVGLYSLFSLVNATDHTPLKSANAAQETAKKTE